MPRRLVKPWHVGRLYGEVVSKDSVCHLETRPSPRARGATPQPTKSQHAGPHLTTKVWLAKSVQYRRSIHAVPAPFHSWLCRLRKCHGDIWFTPRGANAAIPTRVRDLLPMDPLPPYEVCAISCTIASFSIEVCARRIRRASRARETGPATSLSGPVLISRVPAMVTLMCAVGKHLAGPIAPNRKSGKSSFLILARVPGPTEVCTSVRGPPRPRR